MTRLCDITHLDRVGVPVFQAVRPWGRGLSVHQGKGLTRAAAAVGALMEAVESHYAEAYAGPIVRCAWVDLPPRARRAGLASFTVDGAALPGADEPLDWVEARGIGGQEGIWLPFEVVSLDFSWRGDPRLDRSSDGLACRFDGESATAVALCEVIERDAVAAFMALAPWRRALHRIDLVTLNFAWLTKLCGRLEEAGLALTLYHTPGLIALPVIVCEVLEQGAAGRPRTRAYGSACHPDAETTLRKAALEALQSRLTAIAGARDDIVWDNYGQRSGWGLGPPSPPSLRPLAWSGLTEAWSQTPRTAKDMAACLARAGYPMAGVIDLAPGDTEVAVVKAVVPGLGSERRSRRSQTQSPR